MITRALVVILAASSLVSALGCSSATTRLATDAVFPPFHYVDEDGRVTGYDVEVAREALTRAGHDVRVVRVESYDALFAGLLSHRHDLVAATTGITPEREERYAFSQPYFETCQAIAVLSDSPVDHPDDLRGRSVAAATGTTSGRAAVSLGARVVELDKGSDKAAALARGDVEAVIGDEFEVVALADSHDGVRVLPTPAARESYGLVMRLGSGDLRRRINDALDSMEADGTMARLRARFDLDRGAAWPIELTPARTAARPRRLQ